MASPSEKLASSLEILRDLQNKGHSVFKGKQLTQTHRERLIRNGFIRSIIKGWYIPTRPDEQPGESTSWFTSFWGFCSAYLTARLGDDWWLSPEQSLAIHSGNWAVPAQLLVRSTKGNNNTIQLPFNTSIFEIKSTQNGGMVEELDNVRVLSLPSSLVYSSPVVFRESPIDVRTALATIADASQVLEVLLQGGHSVVAGRLAGAFRNIGNQRIADEIYKTMKAAGYDVREQDPFETPALVDFNLRIKSPYVNRIKAMWKEMREPIPLYFPEPPGLTQDKDAYIRKVDDLFTTDAYHSLSIEGYQVSEGLIESVRNGDWNPEERETDRQQKDAMAAKGYWQAFQSVKESIRKIMSGENPGELADAAHGDWYRELWGPSVAAGLLKPSDLAGYRNGPVYIKQSKHVPLNQDAVREAMPTLFELLAEEKEASVRTVLGHFIFVYIHPYMDGNGRIARFLMNTMLASGGYPWTIIKVENRDEYMAALEQASVSQNIEPFAKFIGDRVKQSDT